MDNASCAASRATTLADDVLPDTHMSEPYAARPTAAAPWWYGQARFTLSIVLGLVFLASSLWKIRQPYDFLGAVYDYGIVGLGTGEFIARYLPWLELILAIAFLADLFRLGAFAISSLLLTGFAGLRLYALAAGLEVSCGCFAAATPAKLGYRDLALSVLLCAVSLIGWWACAKSPLASPAQEEFARKDAPHGLAPASPSA